MQVEMWTADDFPKDPPEGCGLTPEQYQDLIDSRLGTRVARPWGFGQYLSAREWKLRLIDAYVMNWM